MRGMVKVALAATVVAWSDGVAQQDFRWTGQVARGGEVRIQGIAGDVRAETATGNRVEVVARKRGPDASEVRVEVEETANGIIVCALYPGATAGEGRCRGSRSGDGERRGRRNFDAEVDFTVRMPAGVGLDVGIVSGDVHAMGMRGPVEVATVAGDIRVSSTGTVEASTVSGDIDATIGTMDAGGNSFNSVSGDVTVRLASGVGADVRVNTLSGTIDSDFELERGDRDRGGWHVEIGERARGRIGSGGPELGVNTVSGSVALRRAR